MIRNTLPSSAVDVVSMKAKKNPQGGKKKIGEKQSNDKTYFGKNKERQNGLKLYNFKGVCR